MRAAVYTRISLDSSGEGLGVARQLEDCLALAERLGWTVVERYDDNDVSAFSGKARPGFETMLEAMARNEFDALICWHTDRLYRSMRDLERLIDIAESAGTSIRTVQGGDLDLSTSAGRMVARILGSVSRQESEHKGERQRRANDQKAAAGKWQTGNRCFGYTMAGEPLEPEASMYRKAVTDVLAGKSIRRVSTEWNAAGVPTTLGSTWTSPRVRRLMVNPRYAALKVHRGAVVGPGEWEPLIDVDTHRGLLAYLSDPARVTATSFEKKYPGSGIYLCGRCGGLMRHGVGGRRPVRRYECETHQHVTRRAEPVDEYVEQIVLAYLRRTDIHVLLADGTKVDIGGLHARREALQSRLDEMAAMFAEGAIDASQLRRGTSDLRLKLADLDSQLGQLSRRSPAADLLDGEPGELEIRWGSLSADLKGKVIDELMTVTILPAPRGRGAFNPDYVDVQPKARG